MHDTTMSRAHAGARELITTTGTSFSARIAEADAMQLRFELLTSRRPAPLRGRLQMGKRLGVWSVLAGTFLDVAELARQHGDDRRELEGEIMRAAVRFARGFESKQPAVIW